MLKQIKHKQEMKNGEITIKNSTHFNKRVNNNIII